LTSGVRDNLFQPGVNRSQPMSKRLSRVCHHLVTPTDNLRGA
jgi:hypothetical protein